MSVPVYHAGMGAHMYSMQCMAIVTNTHLCGAQQAGLKYICRAACTVVNHFLS